MPASSDILSVEECLRWLRANFDKGREWKPATRGDDELPVAAFCRAVRLPRKEMRRWMDGTHPLPRHHVGPLSRFIRDWENGWIEFTPQRSLQFKGSTRREMVRRDTPKKRPAVLKVEFSGGARLRYAPKPAPNYRFPEFCDAFELIRRSN